MIRRLQPVLTALAFAAPLAYVGAAHAGIGACGNIHVEAQAECEVRAGIECEAMCEPLALHAQCAGDLWVQCNVPDRCAFEADVECSGSCEASCMAECEVNPGEFDCRGECYGSCQGNCNASCEGAADGAQCRASCEASCEGECSVSCEATPPSAECSGKCAASCEGSCRADANIDCQIECQAPDFIQCEATLEGGCKGECDADGALFCDGDYVDHGGNLEECIDSLRAVLSIEVETYAEGECGNGRCEGEAGFSCSCNAAEDAWPSKGGLAFAALGIFVFGATRRRSRS